MRIIACVLLAIIVLYVGTQFPTAMPIISNHSPGSSGPEMWMIAKVEKVKGLVLWRVYITRLDLDGNRLASRESVEVMLNEQDAALLALWYTRYRDPKGLAESTIGLTFLTFTKTMVGSSGPSIKYEGEIQDALHGFIEQLMAFQCPVTQGGVE